MLLLNPAAGKNNFMVNLGLVSTHQPFSISLFFNRKVLPRAEVLLFILIDGVVSPSLSTLTAAPQPSSHPDAVVSSAAALCPW